jgi:cysteine desulfurase / selenocysteine lyase
MIYFDNAATSFPKPDFVYKEMEKCIREYCANPGRGSHKMAVQSAEKVFETRKKLCDYFNIDDPNRIIFTKNATEAINYAIKGILKENDHVITTSMEHNSVIRPLKQLEKDKNVALTIIKGSKFGAFNTDQFIKALKPNTKMIITTLSSNVNGMIIPFNSIGKIAKDKNIIYLLDASQGAGSIEIDVKKDNIDMLAFPGHKCLLGPQGVGGLYVSESVNPISIIQGGTGTDSKDLYQPNYFPELLESGTLNTPGIVGLNAGISFINLVGRERIREHKNNLLKHLFDKIDRKDLVIYSKPDIELNSGIFAFEFKKVDTNEIGYVLDNIYRIAVRTGLHCAPLAHETLGTINKGLIRVSFSLFNTKKEVDKLIEVVNEIKENI